MCVLSDVESVKKIGGQSNGSWGDNAASCTTGFSISTERPAYSHVHNTCEIEARYNLYYLAETARVNALGSSFIPVKRFVPKGRKSILYRGRSWHLSFAPT